MHSHLHAMPKKESSELRTTADATPSLSAAIRSLKSGHALDDMVGRTVLGPGAAGEALTASQRRGTVCGAS